MDNNLIDVSESERNQFFAINVIEYQNNMNIRTITEIKLRENKMKSNSKNRTSVCNIIHQFEMQDRKNSILSSSPTFIVINKPNIKRSTKLNESSKIINKINFIEYNIHNSQNNSVRKNRVKATPTNEINYRFPLDSSQEVC